MIRTDAWLLILLLTNQFNNGYILNKRMPQFIQEAFFLRIVGIDSEDGCLSPAAGTSETLADA